MSLLTSILGSALGGGGQAQNPLLNIALSLLANNSGGGAGGLAGIVGSALGGGQQQAGGLAGMIGSALGGGGQQQAGGLAGILGSALGGMAGGAQQAGPSGGLAGLMGAFQQNGMGNVMDSWIGHGENMPMSGSQLQQILGSGQIGQIAQQLGLSPDQASNQLAEILPGLVDKLTPQGQAPQEGFGDIGSMLSMLQGAMK